MYAYILEYTCGAHLHAYKAASFCHSYIILHCRNAALFVLALLGHFQLVIIFEAESHASRVGFKLDTAEDDIEHLALPPSPPNAGITGLCHSLRRMWVVLGIEPRVFCMPGKHPTK